MDFGEKESRCIDVKLYFIELVNQSLMNKQFKNKMIYQFEFVFSTLRSAYLNNHQFETFELHQAAQRLCDLSSRVIASFDTIFELFEENTELKPENEKTKTEIDEIISDYIHELSDIYSSLNLPFNVQEHPLI